jgi:hypothetical protein
MSPRLQHEITAPASLGRGLRREMYALLSRCYDCADRDRFEHDLDSKDTVVLIRDSGGVVRGFSTQAWFDWVHEGDAVRILFSGDTVMEPQFWGSSELARGWCSVAAALLGKKPGRRLFWFLISKGYRTYLYLPLFFREFVPGPPLDPGPNPVASERRPGSNDGGNPSLHRLLNEVASHRFGPAYDAATGLIRFPESQGQLTPELATIPEGRCDDPHVRYFLERNPDFALGVELACLAEVSLENTHGPGRRWLERALHS